MDYITARTKLINQLKNEIKDVRVLNAMMRVPREMFVLPEYRKNAYDDRALPIGLNQTISQPLIVAMMTEALDLTGSEKILEVGTGSGYQTAILAELAQTVVSVERLPELADTARFTLSNLGYSNVAIHTAGESLGWPDGAPYDGIITTAGAPEIPPELLAQVKVDGILVIPVGSRYTQELLKITRHSNFNKIENLGGCRFVSLIGKGSWEN